MLTPAIRIKHTNHKGKLKMYYYLLLSALCVVHFIKSDKPSLTVINLLVGTVIFILPPVYILAYFVDLSQHRKLRKKYKLTHNAKRG